MALPSARLLRGKTACITGGTTGIGRAITLEYLRQGANVAVNHLGLDADERHRKSLLEEAQKLKQQGGSALPTGDIVEVAGDVTDPETGRKLVAEAVRQWGALDVFVANAGIFRAAEFLTWVVFVQKKCRHDTDLSISQAIKAAVRSNNGGKCEWNILLVSGWCATDGQTGNFPYFE